MNSMRIKRRNSGSVLLMVVFALALLSVLVMGMLEINTEELQLMQNQVFAAQALAIAEAGLNDAFSELRADSGWNAGFSDKAFEGGTYTVDVNSSTITSTGVSSQGYVGRVEADITIGDTNPYAIRVDKFRINE
jgi:Tfp pilus assembly protein PilX